MGRYNTTKGINGKGGERATERAIISSCCYTPAMAEAILPSRDASTRTPRLVGEETVEFTAEEMGAFEDDLDVVSGPSELDLAEIEDE